MYHPGIGKTLVVVCTCPFFVYFSHPVLEV